jgi:hypothetical protein
VRHVTGHFLTLGHFTFLNSASENPWRTMHVVQQYNENLKPFTSKKGHRKQCRRKQVSKYVAKYIANQAQKEHIREQLDRITMFCQKNDLHNVMQSLREWPRKHKSYNPLVHAVTRASHFHQTELVEILGLYGAMWLSNIGIDDKDDQTFKLACQHGHHQFIDRLIQDATKKRLDEGLQIACMYGQDNVVQKLIEHYLPHHLVCAKVLSVCQKLSTVNIILTRPPWHSFFYGASTSKIEYACMYASLHLLPQLLHDQHEERPFPLFRLSVQNRPDFTSVAMKAVLNVLSDEQATRLILHLFNLHLQYPDSLCFQVLTSRQELIPVFACCVNYLQCRKPQHRWLVNAFVKYDSMPLLFNVGVPFHWMPSYIQPELKQRFDAPKQKRCAAVRRCVRQWVHNNFLRHLLPCYVCFE